MTTRRLPTLAVLCALALLLAAMGGAAWLALRDGGVPEDDGSRSSIARAPSMGDEAEPHVGARDRTRRPGHLRGSVRILASRSAAPGVVVLLHDESGATRSASTDAAGSFEFVSVAPDAAVALAIDDGRHAPISRPGLRVPAGGELDVGTLWLAAGVRVRVEVHSFTGEPLAGATVRAFFTGKGSPPFDAPTDPPPVAVAPTAGDGVATFAGLPPGAWTFTAQKSGFAHRGLVDATVRAGVDEETFHLALERGHRLTGRVVDRDGSPVRGAPVLAVRRTLPSDPSTAPLALRTVADKTGTFVLDGLPATDVVLWSGWPGRRMAVLAAVRIPLVATIDLTLLRGGTVTGTVLRDADDQPVAGALVTASLRVLGSFTMGFEAEADADGAFSFEMPMPGHLASLLATGTSLGTTWAELGDEGEVALPEGARATFELRLREACRITGTVTGPDGPLAGVSVGATNPSTYHEARTDADGRYELSPLEQARFFVVADLWGFEQPDRPENPDGALQDGSAPARYVADLTSDSEVEIDIALTSGGTLRGRVEAPDGVPAAGALVSLPGVDRAARANGEGRFALENAAPNDSVVLEARLPGVGMVRKELPQRTPGADDEIVLRLEPWPVVRGRISPAPGRSLEGAFVQILAWDGSLDDPVADEWSRLETPRLPVRTDGSFEHPLDVAGAFTVRAGALGHAHASSGRIDVVAGQELYIVELALPEGASAAGRVVSTSGAPIAGAWISALNVAPGTSAGGVGYPGAWGPPVTAVSGPDGTFRLLDLADGPVLVRVRHPGHISFEEVFDDGGAADIEIELTPALTIEGLVVFEDGAPVDGATVRAQADSGSGEGRTDGAGRFRIDGLGPGAHVVSVAASGNGRPNLLPTDVEGVVAPTTDLRVEVRRGLTIRGRVETSDGGPVKDTYVRAALGPDEEDIAWALTNRVGAFTLLGLEPNASYEVRVDGSALDWAAVPVRPDVAAGTDDVVIRLPRLLESSGVLVDMTGAPLGGMTLSFDPLPSTTANVRGIWREANTDDQGRFTVTLVEGTRLRPVLGNHPTWTLPRGAEMVAGARGVRLVAGEGATVAGRVVAPDGSPVPGVQIQALGSGFARTATADERGAFRVTGLDAGESYSFTVSGAVSGAGWTTAVQVTETAPARDLVIPAERLVSAGGRLVARDGSPWAQAYVSLRHETTGNSWGAYTDAEGVFRFESLPRGRFHVTTESPETGLTTPLGEIEAGTTDAVFQLPAR